MERRNDYLAAGQAILDFQLAMLREAMNVAGQGAQRMLELGFAAAAPSAGDPTPAAREPQGPKDAHSDAAALASANTTRAPAYGSRFSDLRFATRSQLASANREYVERMQENVDSMLHALAMAPVAADRFIRAAAAASERPASAATKATAARHAPPKRGKARPAQRGDHAG